ncbi:hypothetical protein [Clostridium senegalense]|uniref:hypothetical protein n=1 Tax=Clostridium senegalense TaxID=1465809 RepID=UPI00138B07CD|nr:hypothetical protein [Clostridium senegalense]
MELCCNTMGISSFLKEYILFRKSSMTSCSLVGVGVDPKRKIVEKIYNITIKNLKFFKLPLLSLLIIIISTVE